MRLFGQISELFKVVWRRNNQEVTLEPNNSKTYTASRTVQLPEGDQDHTLVSRDSNDTLINKIISGASNNITDVDGDKVVISPAGNLTSTNAQAALVELQQDIDTRALDADLTAHEGQASGAHEASAINFNPATNSFTADNVQATLVEAATRLDTAESNISSNDTDITNLQNDKLNRDGTQAMTGSLNMGSFDINNVGTVDSVDVSSLSFNFTLHTASTSAHGVSGAVVGTNNTQVLTNKTLAKPILAGAILDAALAAVVFSNELDASSNSVIYRITGGDTTLSTISTTDANRWIVIINDSGVDLTLENDSGALGIITGTEADLVLAPDSALTLTYNSSAQRWNIVGGAGSGGGLKTEFVAADVNPAANNTHYLVDSSGAPRTITLPDSPQPGAVVRVSDESGTSAANNITIQAGAGDTVEGDSSFIIDVNHGWAQLSWDGTSDWHVDTLAVSDGAGLLSLNGLTTTSSPVQTFSSSDSSVDVVSSAGNHDFTLADTIPGTKTFSNDPSFSSGSQLVTTGTQSFTGAKTFSDAVNLATSSGNVGIGTSAVANYSTGAKTLEIDGGAGLAEIRLTNDTTGASAANANGGLIAMNGNQMFVWNLENDALNFGTNNLTKGNISAAGAWTLGSAGTTEHLVNGGLKIKSTSSTSSLFFAHNGDEINNWQIGKDNSGLGGTDGFYFFSYGIPGYVGGISTAGAWTLGPSSSTTLGHRVNGLTTFSTATTNTGAYVLNVTKAATATSSDGNYFVSFGVSGTNANSGRIATNGVNAAAFFSTSDRRLKTNIQPLDSGLVKIMALNPVSYAWKESGANEVGFIAQEVYEVLPHVVGKKDDDGIGEGLAEGQEAWTLTDGGPKGFLPYLVKAIQELHAELQQAKAEIEALKGGA